MKLIINDSTFGEVSATMIMGPETVFSIGGQVQLMPGCDMSTPVDRGREILQISADVTYQAITTIAAAEKEQLDLLAAGRLEGPLTVEASDGSTIRYGNAVVTPSRVRQAGVKVVVAWRVQAGEKLNPYFAPLAGAPVRERRLLEDGSVRLLESGGDRLLES